MRQMPNFFFFTKNIFLKNDFPENIWQRKTFYAETNGALVCLFGATEASKLLEDIDNLLHQQTKSLVKDQG